MDCADRDRIEEARHELHRIINDREMREAVILIFANKQDLQDGMLRVFKIFVRGISCRSHRRVGVYCVIRIIKSK